MSIKAAYRDNYDIPCTYFDDQDMEIELISISRYKVIKTQEMVKVKPTTEIYGVIHPHDQQ